MAYGTVKVDNITFDNGGSDQNVTVSGLYRATTSGVTVTGTISGAVLVGTTTVSGATVTGNVVQGTTVQGVSGTFTSLTGTTITGTTINAVTVSSTTGTFTSLTGTTITGTTINGVTIAATTGSFTSLTGTTTSGTTANFVSGVFTTQVSGTTVTGTTSSFTSGNFATLSGATATFTSGVIASGTAAAPSLSIISDPNTGIYSPGADQVAISTNGTGRLFVDASGNVGVGGSSNAKLQVNSGDIRIIQTDNTANNGLYFRNAVDSATFAKVAYKAATGELEVGTTDAYSLLLLSNNAERARIDSSGRLLVGTSSASTFFSGASANLQTQSTGTAFGLGIERSTADGVAAFAVFKKTRSASPNGVTIVQNGDSIGNITFAATDGTNPISAANILAEVDGTPGANDMPGRLVFSVTADGAASPTEALRISNDRSITVSDGGNVVLGTTTGTKIGTATTQKIGFYDATPVVQPTAVADATDAASAITQLNALLTRMRNLGLIAT